MSHLCLKTKPISHLTGWLCDNVVISLWDQNFNVNFHQTRNVKIFEERKYSPGNFHKISPAKALSKHFKNFTCSELLCFLNGNIFSRHSMLISYFISLNTTLWWNFICALTAEKNFIYQSNWVHNLGAAYHLVKISVFIIQKKYASVFSTLLHCASLLYIRTIKKKWKTRGKV